MYDPQSEPKEFIGATRSEVVAEACSFFHASEEDLTISELESEAVAGLSGRVAIVAIPRTARRPRRGEGVGRGPAEGRGPRRGGRGERHRAERGERERPERPERRPPPRAAVEDSVGRAKSDLGQEAEFVKGVVERMGLGPFEISESEEGELRIMMLQGPAAEGLGGRDGRGVDALQLLANQAALRIGGDDARRVVIDVEGDSDRRQELVERLADRAASRAEKTGRTIALDPMNGRDRRAVHMALRDREGVTTLSRGEGRYRRVLVVPEGAPEYDEALQASAGSMRDETG